MSATQSAVHPYPTSRKGTKQGSRQGSGEEIADFFLEAFPFRAVTGNGDGDCFDLLGPTISPVLDKTKLGSHYKRKWAGSSRESSVSATLHFLMPKLFSSRKTRLFCWTKQLVKKPLLMNMCAGGLQTNRISAGRGQHVHVGDFREFSEGIICKGVGREE